MDCRPVRRADLGAVADAPGPPGQPGAPGAAAGSTLLGRRRGAVPRGAARRHVRRLPGPAARPRRHRADRRSRDVLPAGSAPSRDRVNATAAPAAARGPARGGASRTPARAPDRPAVASPRTVCSPTASWPTRALRIAAGLRRRGVAPDDAVAVCLPKGPTRSPPCWACWPPARSYVPVGADQPRPRRRPRSTATARIAFAVGAAGTRRGIGCPAEELYAEPPLDAPVTADPGRPRLRRSSPPAPPASPRGSRSPTAAAVNTVADVNERFGVGPDDRVLALSALDFDLSVYDIFGLLGAGGARSCCPTEDERARRRAAGASWRTGTG